MEERSAVLDHLEEDLLHRLLSQRRIAVEIADELPAQCPHVIDVFLDRLRRQIRRCQMLEERTEQDEQLLARRQIFFQPHP
jgi:thymidylate synthase ThyX